MAYLRVQDTITSVALWPYLLLSRCRDDFGATCQIPILVSHSLLELFRGENLRSNLKWIKWDCWCGKVLFKKSQSLWEYYRKVKRNSKSWRWCYFEVFLIHEGYLSIKNLLKFLISVFLKIISVSVFIWILYSNCIA